MGLCVSDGSYIKYTYIIGLGAQPCGAPGPCKYFSWLVTDDITTYLKKKKKTEAMVKYGIRM